MKSPCDPEHKEPNSFTMKKLSMELRLRAALVAVVSILFTGCWSQSDTVSIRADGSVQFTSQVVVEDKAKEFAPGDIEDFIGGQVKELVKAGWTVERKVLSRERPYRQTVTGSGNLKSLRSVFANYALTKVSDKEFKIRFDVPPRKGNDGKRSIIFSQGIGQQGAVVSDRSGTAVTKIEVVNFDAVYTIKLN